MPCSRARGGTMPSWMARAACSSPSVSAVDDPFLDQGVAKPLALASRQREQAHGDAGDRSAADQQRPRRIEQGCGAREGKPARERHGDKDRCQEECDTICRGPRPPRQGMRAARRPPIPPARPRPAAPASLRAGWNRPPAPGPAVPNSSAASGVAATSNVPCGGQADQHRSCRRTGLSEALRRSPAHRAAETILSGGKSPKWSRIRPWRSIGMVRPPNLTLDAVTSTRSASSALRAISIANPSRGLPPARITSGTLRMTPSLVGRRVDQAAAQARHHPAPGWRQARPASCRLLAAACRRWASRPAAAGPAGARSTPAWASTTGDCPDDLAES